MNSKQLAKELGVGLDTLVEWRKLGMPHTRKGTHKTAPCTYDLTEVKQWLSDQCITGERGRPPLGTERDRPGKLSSLDDTELRRLAREADVALKQAKAKLEQLKVEKAKGSLVSVEEVLREHGEFTSRVRSRILSSPGTLAGPCSREADPKECERIIDRHLRHILEGLTLE